MEDNLIEIYSADKMYKIEIIQELLVEDKIESFILNQKGSLFPVGDIRLYVDKKHAARAKEIVASHQM